VDWLETLKESLLVADLEFVGDKVGDSVGDSVGEFVGDVVGLVVGDIVGGVVREVVGTSVGGVDGDSLVIAPLHNIHNIALLNGSISRFCWKRLQSKDMMSVTAMYALPLPFPKTATFPSAQPSFSQISEP